MRRLALFALLVLASCTGGMKLSPAQGLYAGYGSFRAATSSFNEYAQGPTADRVLVSKGRAVVDSDAVSYALRFFNAYVSCQGSNTAKSTDDRVQCQSWNFKDATGVATSLRSAASLLNGLIAKGSQR